MLKEFVKGEHSSSDLGSEDTGGFWQVESWWWVPRSVDQPPLPRLVGPGTAAVGYRSGHWSEPQRAANLMLFYALHLLGSQVLDAVHLPLAR